MSSDDLPPTSDPQHGLEEAGELPRREEGERLATRQWPSVSVSPGDRQAEARATIALYRRELDPAQPERSARLLEEVARLHEEVLADPRSALEALEEAAALAPGSASIRRSTLRLLVDLGNLAQSVALLQLAAGSAESVAARVGLLLELAAVQELKLGPDAKAIEHYRRVLQEEPGNIEAAEALLHVLLRLQDWAGAAAQCSDLAGVEEDPQTRASLLLGSALLDEGQRESERAWLVAQALAADPRSRLAICLAVGLFRRQGDWEQAVRLLEEQVRLVPEDLAPLHFQVSQIYAEHLGQPALALEHALAALEKIPDDGALLAWISDLYRKEARWEELVEIDRRRLKLAVHADEEVEAHAAIAEILEGRLGRLEEAILELEAGLALSPADIPSLQALGRLYVKLERWEALASMHLGAASALRQPSRRAAALYRCAKVCEERLGRRADAITHLDHALRADPRFDPAIRMLGELLRLDGRYPELVALLRDELRRTESEAQRAALLQEIAVILEHHVGDLEEATLVYQELIDLAPTRRASMRALARLYTSQRSFPALLSLLRGEVALHDTPRERAVLLARMAQILEEELRDLDLAIAHCREAIEASPQSSELYELTAQLLRTGERWADLIDLYQRQLRITDDANDRLRLSYLIGRVCEHRIGEPARAALAYRQALEIDAAYWPALRGLVRTVSQTRDPKEMAELETRLLEATTPGRPRAVALFRLGLLLDEEKETRSIAERLYARAIEEDPENALARAMLLRSLIDRGEWSKVVAEVPPLEGALIAWFGLRQPERAIALLKQELGHSPTSLAARRWLEAIYAAAGDRARQARILLGRATCEIDTRRRAAVRFRLAYLAEYLPLEEIDLPGVCRSLLQETPGEPRALEALERVARRRGDHQLLLEVLSSQGSRGPSATARATALAALGATLDRLGRAPEAVAAWRSALEEDPLCRSAYEALKRACSARDDRDGLLWVLERGLDTVSHPEALAFDLLRRADLRIERGDASGGLADLDRVLALHPAQPNALERVERELRKRSDLDGLIQRLRRAAEASGGARLAELSLKLGLIHRDERGDLEEAARELSHAIRGEPDNVSVLLCAAGLHLRLDQPTEALALLSRVALRARQRHELFEAWLGIARIAANVLGDPARARSNLEQILETDPDHREALELLLEVTRQLNDDSRQEYCLRKLATLEADPLARAEHLLELARLIRDRRGEDDDESLAALRSALLLAPGNTRFLQAVVERFSAARRFEELASLIETGIEALPWDKRPRYLLLLGTILGRELGDKDRARRALREALRGDPDNEQVAEALLEQLDAHALESPEWRGEAIGLYHRILRRDPLDLGAIRALRTLCELEGRIDESFAAESALILLAEATEEEAYFHRQRRRRAPSRAARPLDPGQLEALVGLPSGDHPIRPLLAILRPHLAELAPGDLEAYGIDSLESARLGEDDSATLEAAGACAALLGIADDAFALATARGGVPRGALEPGLPPSLILPGDFLKLPVPEQRFLCGRLLTRVALGTESLDPGRSEPLSSRSIGILLAAVIRAVEPGFGDSTAPQAILDDLAHRLQRRLSPEELAAAEACARSAWDDEARASLPRWLRSCELGACRGGLICSGGLQTAAAFLQRTGEPTLAEDLLRSLCGFTLSDELARLRLQLGLALTSEGAAP